MDEVPRGAWSDDADEEAALLAKLAAWLQRFLADRGRSLLGWEEAFYDSTGLSATSSPRPAAVAWKQDERFAANAANGGLDVILSPAHFLYFDIVQGLDFEDRGLYWAVPTLPVERVYSYEPMERLQRLGLRADATERVRGVQAALWGETVATAGRAEEMLFPRIFAAAEVGWTEPARRSWVDFQWRLPQQLRWFHTEWRVHYGGAVSGLLFGSETMMLPRLPPCGSGGPAGIAGLDDVCSSLVGGGDADLPQVECFLPDQ